MLIGSEPLWPFFFVEDIYRKLRGNACFRWDCDESFVPEGKTIQIKVRLNHEQVMRED